MVAIGILNCFVTRNSELFALRHLATRVRTACINEALFDSTVPK